MKIEPFSHFYKMQQMNTFANNLFWILTFSQRNSSTEEVVCSPLFVAWQILSRWWSVAALEIASELQRSITMMQINKRHIKMRQKLINRFWRFWRACWGISMVEALLIAERVRYWTFSMTQESKEVWSFKRWREW